MDYDSLDENRKAKEAEATLASMRAEQRLAHHRIIACLVGLSVVVGLFLYFVK